MRKTISTVAACLAVAACSAQWVTLNSTTTNHLRDVDFTDPNKGVIVGDAGTILYTSNGGTAWTDINNGLIHGDIYSVTMINSDTIYVSSFDAMSTSATIYLTMNGGAAWNPVASTSTTNHKMDLGAPVTNHLFATGTDLIGTTDMGNTWDTLYPNIAGTTSLSDLKFADASTGHASGLVAGFASYSAYFIRSGDGGAHWYSGDVFSFPNSDAFTALCFINADTAYMFTNHYIGFSQGTQNGMIRMTNFQLNASPFDTLWGFSSSVINSATPCYVNDAYFDNASHGFIAGKDGNVHVTSNGGTNWSVDYTGSAASPLNRMKFTGNTGYAVGDNGTLIKYTTMTGIGAVAAQEGISVYPNPANDRLVIAADHGANAAARILDVNGKEVAAFTLTADRYVFDASSLSAGIYFLEVRSDENAAPVRLKWMKQ